MENPYKIRRDKLKELLYPQGVETVIINNPINIFYFSGRMLMPLERYVGLIINFPQDKAFLILPQMDIDKENREIMQYGYLDGENHLLMLEGSLNIRNKVGVEKGFVTLGSIEELSAFSGLKWENYFDISPQIKELRRYKDSLEIEYLQKAAHYTDSFMGLVHKRIKPGVRDREITLYLLNEIELNDEISGAAFEPMAVSGIRTSKAHGLAGDNTFQKGQPFLVDFGVAYNHYKGDITRTFFAEKPAPKLADIYKIVLEANLAAIDIIRPGIKIKEVDLAARKVIEKAGYGEYFTHRTGHGLGIEAHEAPSIHQKNEEIIKEGLVFTVEPGIYIPKIGGCRVEDDILVKPKGCQVLTKYPKSLEDMLIIS